MLWLGQEMDRTAEFKTDISTNLKFKIVVKKFLQQKEGHSSLVPYCTYHSNEHLYSFFLLPLTAYELSAQITCPHPET
jgi:hypothetical protein